MYHITYSKICKALYDKHFYELVKHFPFSFQNKLYSFGKWQDAYSSLLGRLLLKWSLKEYYNYQLNFDDIVYFKNEKPYLKDDNFYFNISHSGELVCCVISEKQKVGIDIELINSDIDFEDFYPQMTKFEIKNIKKSKDQLVAFYQYWTEKESVLKLTGKGLSIRLNSFELKNNVVELFDKKIFTKELTISNSYVCNFASFVNMSSLQFTTLEVENYHLF